VLKSVFRSWRKNGVKASKNTAKKKIGEKRTRKDSGKQIMEEEVIGGKFKVMISTVTLTHLQLIISFQTNVSNGNSDLRLPNPISVILG